MVVLLCFCGGVVVFLWWCGGVVVFLWWCFFLCVCVCVCVTVCFQDTWSADRASSITNLNLYNWK